MSSQPTDKTKTTIIYLFGHPSTGKYTIGFVDELNGHLVSVMEIGL